MALCPAGHQSQTADYCDVCGEAIVGAAPAGPTAPGVPAGTSGGSAAGSTGSASEGFGGVPAGTPAAAGTGIGSAPGPTGGPTAPTGTTCANCGAAVSGRFCEECGYDTALPAPAQPAVPTSAGPPAGADPSSTAAAPSAGSGWSVVIRADRAWYTRAEARGGPDAGSVTFPPYFAERRFRLVGPEMMIGKRDEAAGIHPAIDLRVQPEDVGISRSQAVLRQRADGGWEVVDIGSTNGTVVGDSDTPITEFTPVPLEPGDQFHIGAWTTITLVQG